LDKKEETFSGVKDEGAVGKREMGRWGEKELRVQGR
jgi:hypothetical protein